MGKPLGPVEAGRIAGFDGKTHNIRRNMIAYIERRERALGIKLWTRDSNGRREITEATLRLHCPELFELTLQKAQAEFQRHIEKLEHRLHCVVDSRIERPIAALRTVTSCNASNIAHLAQVTENRFQQVESRLSVIEGMDKTDANRREPTATVDYE